MTMYRRGSGAQKILSGFIATLCGCMAMAMQIQASANSQPGYFSRFQENAHAAERFQPVATFDVMAGNNSSVAEIIDVSPDGNQLVYTDAHKGEIGFVDIAAAEQPTGQGVVVVGGEPTSLVVRDTLVLVVVNTSASYADPSGKLVVVDRTTRNIVAEHTLPGQPDSIALSPDHQFAAIVIESERDEEVNNGLLLQSPTGSLVIVDLKGAPTAWKLRAADLSPVASHAAYGGDLEPEFVDINDKNEAVLTFQENNHLAVVDLPSGKTLQEFPAGSVTLHNVDNKQEGLIRLDSEITKRREPDAVAWLDRDTFATANEGDYMDADGELGGSRGFTVFRRDGSVVYESAESFEHALVSAGHYNEGRSEAKGVEPESVEFARFGTRDILLVGSERGNAVGVFAIRQGKPDLLQVLPTGIAPEGLRAIPQRGLFVTASETGAPDVGIPTMINIYGMPASSGGSTRDESRTYPMIASGNDSRGLPIPWAALSGLAADPRDANTLYAVSDGALDEGFIYRIDVSGTPARIVERLQVTGASAHLDLEGVAVGADGAFWLASEGSGKKRKNLVLEVDAATGAVRREIQLPAVVTDKHRGQGMEGIAVTGTPGAEVIYVALQRAGKKNTLIGRYSVASGNWGFVHYPLQPQGRGGKTGLSELTALPDGQFAVIERDRGWGPSTGLIAELKAVYKVDLAAAEFRPYDDPAGLVTVSKSLLVDVLPVLAKNSIWTAEKLEGLAVARDGSMYVVTDNDGLKDATGETVFLNLGKYH